MLFKQAHHHHHHPHVSKDLYKVFHPEETKKKSDKEEEKKVSLETALYWRLYRLGRPGLRLINLCLQVKGILSRLEEHNVYDLREAQVEYALRSKSANGDSDKAFDMLMLFEEALQGTLKEPDRTVNLVGAENRELVTCYLDSLLFAMYARLDSFEEILADNFTDSARKKLATILRLWVNMLRSGNLITTDITKHLQEALGACGWEEATQLHQQDVSEAFTFITDKLDLPLLTLKMDVYHTGKEDADDHKIVRERLLEVAIPPPSEDGSAIKLEDCLEAYFNNKIEVKRHLQRRNTLQSLRPVDGKAQILHVETVELPAESPGVATPQTPPPPFSPSRPIDARRRGDSIFSERWIDYGIGESSGKKAHDDFAIGTRRHRASTIRREVLMPAWQFFSLIPWHTQDNPKNDVQVAHHLSTKRPVLGICLKRYSVTPQGARSRLDTYIDIPLEIGLPHFISDDSGDEFGSNFTNFKLSLQSVVCHRGNSLDSGHYVALVRSDPPARNHLGENGAPDTEQHEDAGTTTDAQANQWLRSDDLASERVTHVDIKKALREECPYLLFYRVQPTDDELFRGNPPSYESIIQPGPSNQTESVPSTTDPSSSDLANTADTSTIEVATVPTGDVPVVTTVTEVRPDQSTTLISTTTPADTPRTLPVSDATVPSLELIKTRSINVAELQLTNDGIDVRDTAPNSLAVRPHSIDLSTLERSLLKKSSQDLTPDDVPRGRTSMSSAEDRRSMLTFTDTTTSVNGSVKGGSSAPITPGDDPRTSYISTGVGPSNAAATSSRRNSRSWRNALREKGSRPSSATGEGRISFSMTRLKNAMSRDKLNVEEKERSSGGEESGTAREETEKRAGGTIRRGKSLRSGKKRARSRSGVRALAGEADEGVDGSDRECIVM